MFLAKISTVAPKPGAASTWLLLMSVSLRATGTEWGSSILWSVAISAHSAFMTLCSIRGDHLSWVKKKKFDWRTSNPNPNYNWKCVTQVLVSVVTQPKLTRRHRGRAAALSPLCTRQPLTVLCVSHVTSVGNKMESQTINLFSKVVVFLDCPLCS